MNNVPFNFFHDCARLNNMWAIIYKYALLGKLQKFECAESKTYEQLKKNKCATAHRGRIIRYDTKNQKTWFDCSSVCFMLVVLVTLVIFYEEFRIFDFDTSTLRFEPVSCLVSHCHVARPRDPARFLCLN